MFLPYSIYFNTQICTLCLIKSEAKYNLVQKQKCPSLTAKVRCENVLYFPHSLNFSSLINYENKPTSCCEWFVSLREIQSLFLAQANAT